MGTASPDVERPKLVYISSTAPSHDRLGHPECAARGAAIMDALQANKLTPDAIPGQVRLPRSLSDCRSVYMVTGSVHECHSWTLGHFLSRLYGNSVRRPANVLLCHLHSW